MGNHRGERGHPGRDGSDGRDGGEGPQGPKGDPGESSVLVLADGAPVVPAFRGIVLPRPGKLRHLYARSRFDVLTSLVLVVEVNGDPTDLHVTLEKGERRGSEKRKYIRTSEGDMVSLLARLSAARQAGGTSDFDPTLLSNLMVSLLLE